LNLEVVTKIRNMFKADTESQNCFTIGRVKRN
jgi:hypothetical protein